jgi:hypothetical protein
MKRTAFDAEGYLEELELGLAVAEAENRAGSYDG